MLQQTLGFIGGGNMARSLIGGLIARGLPAAQITVADPIEAQRELLTRTYGVRTSADNTEAARAQILILAVKPQELKAVAQQLSHAIAHRPTIISVAAGVRTRDLQRWLGGADVIRCMPNTLALKGAGVTGLFATPDVDETGRRLASEILGAVGPALWVEREEQIDAVTAVSGSGPAYFFLLIEMLETTGVQLGLPADVAHRLAVETAYGSGTMARTAPEPAATLRQQVTSKGGTTEAALNSLEAANVRAIFAAAITAAARRSAELADQLGK